MAGSSKRDARKADQAELRRQALELRKAGATYEEITQALKLSTKSLAYHYVKRAIADITAEPAREVLAIELERLDRMLRGLWQKARIGDVTAIDRVLRIMDRRARFLGLDAPAKAELTGKDGGPVQVEDVDPTDAILGKLAGIAADLAKRGSGSGSES